LAGAGRFEKDDLMNDWSGGYVSDVEYVAGYYGEQSPASMELSSLICGVEPPRNPGDSRSFDYCEIGCGHGTTLATLAATNPEGRFVGVDFMPAHIARAEDFARRAQLDNLRYIEADVLALADSPTTDLPQFDYVSLHGVYSWVSPEVRAGIIRFLQRFVRPGGLVYISYNALPGWQPMAPTQRFMFEFAKTLSGDSITRASGAIEFIRRMHDAKAPGIDPRAVSLLTDVSLMTRLPEERAAYLAHEFLNACWQPLFHMDVARDLAGAKLSFVGSAARLENFAGVGLTKEAQALLDGLPEGPLRETTKDYFNGRVFRRDIFVRGRRVIDAAQRDRRLGEVQMLKGASAPTEDHKAEVLGSTLTLNHRAYAPLFAALENGMPSVMDLCDAAAAHGARMSATEVLGMVSGLGFGVPVLRDVTLDAVRASRRHNAVQAADALVSRRQLTFALAVPVGHSGMTVSSLDTGVLDGLFKGVPAEVEALSAHILAGAEIDPNEVRGGSAAVLKTTKAAPESTPSEHADDATLPMGQRVRTAVKVTLAEVVPRWVDLGILTPEEAGLSPKPALAP
jgi:SAM-dependent methyltransferase